MKQETVHPDAAPTRTQYYHRLARAAIDPGPPMTLTLAAAPLPVPAPVAAVLRQHLDQHRGPRPARRRGQRLAVPRHSTRLLPAPAALTHKLQQHGIPARAPRIRALQHLVTTAPPPAVADLLGHSPCTAFRHHEQAAGRYNRYAATAAEAI